MPKIVAISDTHNHHRSLTIPHGDILIHAGDYSNSGSREATIDFLDWLEALPHPHKILIAGNHDFFAERDRKGFRALVPKNICYLENESVTIENIKIWGSPFTPYFGGWAFNLHRGAEIKKVWDTIPEDTDILVTHGPPHGILDQTYRLENVGCEELLLRINAIKPHYHIFGHIHECPGIKDINGTTFINATQVDLMYRPVYDPIVFEYTDQFFTTL